MFLNVFTQVAILLILILVGILLEKIKVLTDDGVKSMTDMVLLTVTPCVIIKSFIREFDRSTFNGVLLSFLIAFLSHIGFIILSHIFIKDHEKSRERVLRFAVIFSNCGFMSIPLQQALIGDIGVLYSASYIAVFNIFIWSYGILLMSGDKKYLTPKKLILNPGIISVFIGIIIFILSIPVPKIIAEPISYIAGLNTPVPMIIIGFHLARSNILNVLKNFRCLWAIGMRLVVFPAVALGVMYLCGVKGDMLVSSVISCSAPTAALSTMFAAKFGGDTSTSVNIVSFSTVLSLLTMPLLISFAQLIA